MFRINLSEIPETGREWTLDRQSGELNEVLRDLIEDSDYNVEFKLMPMPAGTYNMSGRIKTSAPEDCSRCGLDFKWPVNESFRELLIPSMEVPRDAHYAKANHISDHTNNDGPSVVEYSGSQFQMGEFLHEIVALAIPSFPAPAETKEGDCSTCLKKVRGQSFAYDEDIEKKENPFNVLRTLKN